MEQPTTPDELLVAAARAIRPRLNALVGAAAPAVDRQLAVLLTRARGGEDVESLLLAELGARPELQRWAAAFLELGHPPELEAVIIRDGDRSALSWPPGDPSPVQALRYGCPLGDYDWYAATVGEPVVSCPTHQCLLERVPRR